ncbi:MAG: hypothetical protein JWM86_416 [Thermoleophilia bacterium]|nr:hypothetical protein [Thermoleophilia bacterium]
MADLEFARRAGRREANLRVVNERIAESLERQLGDAVAAYQLLCECAREDCDKSIRLPAEAYDAVRESVSRFVVVDGHVLYDVERIVDRGEAWVVVEKYGEAALAAEEELT